MKQKAAGIFSRTFGSKPDTVCFAPGRINLIGEHTDYNGGHVMPCAINMGIVCAAKKRSDKMLRFYSADFDDAGIISCSLEALSEVPENWAAYPFGVIKAFATYGYIPESGADFAFCGNIPDGAGLSSSAALEVLTGACLRELYGFGVTDQIIAYLGQFAENISIGVKCGIMDQFASALGKQNSAVLLDTGTLEYKYAPIPDNIAVVIINSCVKHSLASSAYNDRRRECETALADLRPYFTQPPAALCRISPADFEQNGDHIRDKVCFKRARHAVTENDRTIRAAKALKDHDLELFGKLMKESHISLRDDYEVTCAELDFLAEKAWAYSGVFGARMTGGGFGGCTINLVEPNIADAFVDYMSKEYFRKFGIVPKIYRVKIGNGVTAI